jgi:hypothetical protein
LTNPELERNWQNYHRARATYVALVSKRGNKIQGRADGKRKRIEAPADFREYFTTKVLKELIYKTVSLTMHEDDENYKVTKVF